MVDLYSCLCALGPLHTIVKVTKHTYFEPIRGLRQRKTLPEAPWSPQPKEEAGALHGADDAVWR